jgi:hypothetical protein
MLWAGGMVAAGGRVPMALLGLPLVPKVTHGCSREGMWWAKLAAGALILGGAAVVFWLFVGLPIGDALFGPVGVLR